MLQIKGNERGTYVTCDPRLTVGQKAIFFFAIEDMIGKNRWNINDICESDD